MRALCISKLGDAPVLACLEQPEPTLRDAMDIIVRVRAAGVNRVDVFRRAGTHGTTPERFPFIVGRDFAGDVEEVGSEVSRLKIGDRVFGTGSYAQAELMRVNSNGQLSQESVELIPDDLSYEDAASVPTAFSMAYHMLHCDGHLQAGEDVLVMGASGGVASGGVQIAKAAGARVIATAGTAEKLERARALGADDVFNYRQVQKFSSLIQELTGGQGVGLVLEHIGGPVWEECWASLKRGGRYVICGVTAGHRVSLHLGQLWMRRLSLIGSLNDPENDLKIVADLIERGAVYPVVDSVFPLEEAAEAHKRMEARDFFGKIVLTIS